MGERTMDPNTAAGMTDGALALAHVPEAPSDVEMPEALEAGRHLSLVATREVVEVQKYPEISDLPPVSEVAIAFSMLRGSIRRGADPTSSGHFKMLEKVSARQAVHYKITGEHSQIVLP